MQDRAISCVALVCTRTLHKRDNGSSVVLPVKNTASTIPALCKYLYIGICCTCRGHHLPDLAVSSYVFRFNDLATKQCANRTALRFVFRCVESICVCLRLLRALDVFVDRILLVCFSHDTQHACRIFSRDACTNFFVMSS